MKKYYLTIASFLFLVLGLVSCSKEEAKTHEQVALRPTEPIQSGEVRIGTQVWMTKNLNTSKYSDGTPIPQVTDQVVWANLTTGAWCYYSNIAANGTTYGKLYNWYAVAGIYNAASASNPALRKKLAPTGWHVPTDNEWNILIHYVDPNINAQTNNNVAGGKMKSTGTTLWQPVNVDATNESGFTGLPGGYRVLNGVFFYIGNNGYWWSSSEGVGTIHTEEAEQRYLTRYDGIAYGLLYFKKEGMSVRCIKD